MLPPLAWKERVHLSRERSCFAPASSSGERPYLPPTQSSLSLPLRKKGLWGEISLLSVAKGPFCCQSSQALRRNGEGGFGGWLFSILPVAFKRGLSWGKREGPTAVLLSLEDNMEVSHAGGTDLPSSICVLPRGLEGRRPTEREDFAALLGNRPQWAKFVPVPPGQGGRPR